VKFSGGVVHDPDCTWASGELSVGDMARLTAAASEIRGARERDGEELQKQLDAAGQGEAPYNAVAAALGDPVALTQERGKSHGDWMHQAAVGVGLDQVLQAGQSYAGMRPYQRKAVDMIAVKLSRIVAGDASFDDHWDDIAGYAHLGKGGHTA